MSEEKRPQAGELYWNGEDESEIAEVLEDRDDGSFKIADEDGEEAVIKWNADEERWEVDA